MRHNKLLEVALNKTDRQSDSIQAFLNKNKVAIKQYKEAKHDKELGTIQEERAAKEKDEQVTKYNFENVRRTSIGEEDATITTNLNIMKGDNDQMNAEDDLQDGTQYQVGQNIEYKEGNVEADDGTFFTGLPQT